MRQGDLRTIAIVGFILVVSGIVLLLYYVAPIRLMAEAIEPHETSPVPAILGGLALISGIALLGASRRLRG
jgi:hypothetical protein